MGYEIKNLYRASYLEKPKNKDIGKYEKNSRLLFLIIKSVLILKIVFTAFPVLPNLLKQALEIVSNPLVYPFNTMLGTPLSNGLDVVAIFALSFYAILGWMITGIFNSYIASSPAEESTD
jgi:hypothetical protein